MRGTMMLGDWLLMLGVGLGALTMGCGKLADEAGADPSPAGQSGTWPPPPHAAADASTGVSNTPVATDASADVPPIRACGTRGGITCPAGTYCKFAHLTCGRADQGGQCVAFDADCSDPVVDPVCGCDDRSYVSSCHAGMNGVSIKAPGRCEDFECGKATCDATTSYCEADDTGGGVCKPLPPPCKPTAGGAPRDCSCFSLTPCASCPDQCGEQPAGSVSAFTLYWSN